MILILIRLEAKIPVIMMGETGCGKTSLIRKLSELKNNGDSDKLKILNIHSGTTDYDIINDIKKIILSTEKEKEVWIFLDEINTCNYLGLISELICNHTYLGNPIPKNIVFIAACNPYRQREKKLDKKVGLCAIRAFKQIKNLNENQIGLVKANYNNELVYTVKPLPQSLLNFVFDFGSLSEKDEKDYVRNIIEETFNKIYFNIIENRPESKKLELLKSFAVDMIIKSQNFIRELNDRSAVSLREIRRFNIFFEFFSKYLAKKYEFISDKIGYDLSKNFFNSLDNNHKGFPRLIYCVILSGFFCYCLKITDKEKRNELIACIEKIIKQYACNLFQFPDIDLSNLFKQEEQFIVDNMKLDNGIAKNQALLDNIFSLFISINTKVPIFIVGNPGCSKSLSVKLITQAMQGRNSDNDFFKKFPKLSVFNYQGSMISTPSSVTNIFKQAGSTYTGKSTKTKITINESHEIYTKNKKKASKNIINDKKKEINQDNIMNNEDIIPVVFFDEIGLAQYSPYNPLNVIHSELENDSNEEDKKIAFVGLSNWLLDAAKMNRGVSITIPDPEKDDAILTAITIARSYSEILEIKYSSIFEGLGEKYYEYKERLMGSINYKFFHGNRDFYYSVKNMAKNLLKLKDKEISENHIAYFLNESIERNYAGITDADDNYCSLRKIKLSFNGKYPWIEVTDKYDLIKRIQDNLEDNDCRYLLIFGGLSITDYIISKNILNISKDKRECIYLVGSCFPNDLFSEEYVLKVVKKIQIFIEENCLLVLSNLDSVYPSLYDLFNQNFTVIAKKNFTHLSISAYSGLFSYVNEGFKCIVISDKNKKKEEEAPFLNRFEKHSLDFESLLLPELVEMSKLIQSLMKEIISCDYEIFKAMNYSLEHLLINCSLEEIQAIIFYFKNERIVIKEIIEKVFSKIALTLPQDIIINMLLNGFNKKHTKYFKTIFRHYKKLPHSNFASFIKETSQLNNVIYTFSDSIENIENIDENIKNSKLNIEFNRKNVEEIIFNSIKSENELENHLEDLYSQDNYKVLIVKFKPYETKYMDYLKYFIGNKQIQYQTKNNKIIIFIVHMKRILKEDLNKINKLSKEKQEEINNSILGQTLSNLSGYCQVFIDNLNGSNDAENKKFEKIMKSDSKEIFKTLIDFEKELKYNAFKCISYMKFNLVDLESDKKLDDNYYNMELMGAILFIKDQINNCIEDKIFKKNEDVIHNLFTKENFIKSYDIDVAQAIERFLIQKYKQFIKILLFTAEKDNFFAPLIKLKKRLEINDIYQSNLKEKNNFIYHADLKKKEDDTYGKLEKYVKKYFEKLVLDDRIEIIEKPLSNEIHIIQNFECPGIKSILCEIRSFIKNKGIARLFMENENSLRESYGKDLQQLKMRSYFEFLEKCNDDLENYFNKINFNASFDNIKNIEPLLEIKLGKYKHLLYDYITLFIYSNWKKIKKPLKMDKKYIWKKIRTSLVKIFEFRKDIISHYFNLNKYQNDLKYFAFNILWLESYEEDIILIISLLLTLDSEAFTSIKNVNEIEYEINFRNPEYCHIVNKIFFVLLDRIFESLMKLDYYIKDNVFLFGKINYIKSFLPSVSELDKKYMIRVAKIHTLEQIIKLLEAYNSKKAIDKSVVDKIILYFNQENKYLENKLEEKLIEEFNIFYKELIKDLGKCKDFYKILNFIFLKELYKFYMPKFRVNNLKQFFSDKKLLINCSQFIKIILNNTINGEYILENVDDIKNEKEISFIEINTEINDKKNPILEELIINFIENNILFYFDNSPNILLPKEFNAFEKLISILSAIKEKEEKDNKNILKLYSIAYIKIYLYKFISLTFNNDKIRSYEKVTKIIKDNNDNPLKEVLQTYIYKIFYFNLDKNIYKLKKYVNNNKDIVSDQNFEIFSKSIEYEVINYNFIPLNNEKNNNLHEILLKFFKMNEILEFKAKTNIDAIIEIFGLDLFITITMNTIISKFYNDDYLRDKGVPINFFSDFESLEFVEKHKSFVKLCDLLYTIDKEKNLPKIFKKLKRQNLQIYEIILHGFRFCINSLDSNKVIERNQNNDIIKLLTENNFDPKNSPKDEIAKKVKSVNEKLQEYENKKDKKNKNDSEGAYLFRSFFEEKQFENIKNKFIPGIDSNEDYHLTVLEYIQSHFENYTNDDYGCYVCKCGFYHYLPPNGFPNPKTVFNCPYCDSRLGWDQEKKRMFYHEGYYRIFKNEEDMEKQIKRWEVDVNSINWILKDKYIEKFIKPVEENPKSGFVQLSKNYFKDKNRKVRKLSFIGYRLLNLISYLFLFFGYSSGFIDEKDFKDSLIKDMDILDIIEYDWNLLREFLAEKNVWSIQIFFNIIFEELSKSIIEFKSADKEGREVFEQKVEEIIKKCIDNFDEASQIYQDLNCKLYYNQEDKYKYREIIAELYPLTRIKSEVAEHPLFKYFYMTDYKLKSLNYIGEKIRGNKKYPLLSQIFAEDKDIFQMKKLESINQFENYLIDFYSYKIPRDNKIILKRYFDNDCILKELYEKCFINEKKNLKYSNIMGGDELIENKSNALDDIVFKEDKSIIYFINDNYEKEGMYIPSIYSKLINIQNSILDKIKNSYYGTIYNYSNDISTLIPIQKAFVDETLLIEKRINDNDFLSLDYFINYFSERDIFIEDKDGQLNINYANYNSLKWDYTELEKNCYDIFLPQLKAFESEEHLTWFIFASENLRGGNSDLFEDFNIQYTIEEITTEEKKKIFDYIIKNLPKYYNFYMKEFLESLLLIIFYYAKMGLSKDKKIISITKNLPAYIHISKALKNFLESIDLKINKITYLFLLLEHLYFSDSIKLLNQKYKEEINDPKKIKEYFSNGQDITTKKNLLASILRRYITRFLIENNLNAEITSKRPLLVEIGKKNLWSIDIPEREEQKSSILKIVREFELNVSQAYALYNLIGEEDRALLKDFEEGYKQKRKLEEKKGKGKGKYEKKTISIQVQEDKKILKSSDVDSITSRDISEEYNYSYSCTIF